MKNRYEIDARKSNAKIMKNERKWSPNGSQNPSKIKKCIQKRGPKNDAKIMPKQSQNPNWVK